MTTSIAKEMYVRLLQDASNKRLRESLERVNAACDFLESSRAAITPTAVGRYCAERFGGPKAQSIRNAEDTLFAYLKARGAQQVLPAAARSSSFEPIIVDETVRAYVALLKAERDEAIRTKNRIVNGLRSIPGVPIDELIQEGLPLGDNRKVLTAAAEMMVSAAVQDAVNRLFDPNALAAVGMELYRMRLRNRVTNQVLLEKQHVEVLTDLVQDKQKGEGGSFSALASVADDKYQIE